MLPDSHGKVCLNDHACSTLYRNFEALDFVKLFPHDMCLFPKFGGAHVPDPLDGT